MSVFQETWLETTLAFPEIALETMSVFQETALGPTLAFPEI
jgi:hypothetical protein